MRLRSKNSHFRSKNLPLRSLEKLVSSNQKLLKLKPLKSNLIRLLRSSRDCTLRDTSSTSNGRRPLRIQEKEMNSLMRLVRTMLELKIILTKRKLTSRTIKINLREKKIIILISMDKLHRKKELLRSSGSHSQSLILRERTLKVKLQF